MGLPGLCTVAACIRMQFLQGCVLSAQAMAMLHNVAHYGQLLSPKRGPQRQPADLPTREDDYNGVGQYLMGESVSG